MHGFFQQYFIYIVAINLTSEGNQNTRRKPPTCRKILFCKKKNNNNNHSSLKLTSSTCSSFLFVFFCIFVMIGWRDFQHTVGIHMGANCASLLADLFLYSYEPDVIQWLLKKNEKKLGIKGTTYINRSASHLDLYLEIDNKGRLGTKH